MKSKEQMQKEISDVYPDIILVDEYTGANDKHQLHCNKCGHRWFTVPRAVVKSAKGCPKCGISKKVENNKNKIKEDSLSKIDYSKFDLIEYKSETEIIVSCKVCGNIRTTNKHNIIRYGCKSCSSVKSNEPRKLNNEEFIKS